jgi:hypothetical protein
MSSKYAGFETPAIAETQQLRRRSMRPSFAYALGSDEGDSLRLEIQ